jgi:hypothetical protein
MQEPIRYVCAHTFGEVLRFGEEQLASFYGCETRGSSYSSCVEWAEIRTADEFIA